MWQKTSPSEKIGTVNYKWVPTYPQNTDLVLEIGTRIYLASKNIGWYHAVVKHRSSYMHFTIPCSYVKIIPPGEKPSKKNKYVYYEKNIHCQLIYSALNEWVNSLKNSITDLPINRLVYLVTELMNTRNNIKDPYFEPNITEIVNQINEGNRMFSLEYIPVYNNQILDIATADLVQIFESHSDDNPISSAVKPLRDASRKTDNLVSKKPVENYHHLYVSLRSASCGVNDPTLWVCGIYDADNDTYITEKFLANVKEYPSQSAEFPINQNALFEINNSCAKHSLYLFIKIYRVGNLTGDKKSDEASSVRRPFGFSTLFTKDLKNIVEDNQFPEKIPIFICEDFEFGGAERGFHKDTMTTAKGSITYGFYVDIDVQYFNLSLSTIKNEHPEIFKDEIYLIPFIGMPDIMDPEQPRNSFYITLKSVNFEKLAFKGKQMNIEATISAWNNQGQLICNCIKAGHGRDVGLETEYNTSILYHTNQPIWNETLGFVFPTQKLDAHEILVIFKHISSSTGKSKVGSIVQVGLTCIKLKNADNTIISGSDITYYIKKVESAGNSKGAPELITEDVRKLSQAMKEQYSALEIIPDNVNKFSSTDYLKIKAKLYSTRFTYNPDVYILKELKPGTKIPNIDKIVFRFCSVETAEIVKFIQPLFQSIVGMMVPSDNYRDDCIYFQAFAKILTVVNEPRFVQYEATLEKAIQSTKMPFCWKYIIGTLINASKNITDTTTRVYFENVKYFIDNLTPILKILMKSYQDFQSSNPNQESMSDQLVDMFEHLFPIFSVEDAPYLLSLQVKLIENFISVIVGTGALFSMNQIGQMVSSLLSHILLPKIADPGNESKYQGAFSHEVKFLDELINCPLYSNKEFRDIMWPIIVMNLEKFIHTEFKNVHLCIIVAHVLTGSLKYSELEENGGIRHLLIELVTYFMEISESSDCLTLYSDEVDSLSVLLSLLGLMNKSIFVEYFRPYNNTKKAEHLTRWYHVFRNILFSKNYRNSHAVEWMAIGRVLLSANKDLCPVLIETFESIHNDPCRITLLHKFLDFVLDFINFNRTLGYNLINIYLVEYLYSVPDMRAEMANVLLSIWDKLDQDDLASLYDYTRTLVVSSLIDIPDVRSCMFKILHNFMVYDYKSHGCMDKVTRTIISYIDSDTYTHDRYQVFASDFKKCMEGLWEAITDPSIKDVGRIATGQILEIIDTVAFYSLPDKFEKCVFLQALRCHQMIEFHKRIGHSEMMQANYALLLRSNQAMDAHTETAMCYFRLSENYEWEFGTDLPQLAMFGPSTPGDRKEEFLIKAVEFFEKGFNLEYAIDACKMLLTLYASFKIDFIKLSRWHKRIADLYERIAKGESSIDNYFRIIFIGKDFPQSIQNKSFICHMGSCATLGNTVSLLKKHFPNAKIPSTSFIDEKLYEQNVQYIFVQAYQPLPKDFQLYERYYLASATVSRFYKNAGTDQFQGTTTIEHKKGDGSQPTLSFIKTLVKLGYDLPSIILVSPITVEEKTKITEFEQNIDMVRDNANELLDLVRSYDLNPLMLKTIQMKLSGCLNAFVNGGLSLILPKYFNEDFMKENADGLDVMRNALYQFMSAISCSMKLLFKNVPDELAGFVLNLFESYQVTRSSLQQKANVESEDLSSFIQSSTSVNPPSAPVSSGRKGSIMSRGSNMDLTSGSSSIKEVDIVPEMQKKEKGFTIRSIRAFKSPKATLLDEKSSVFSGAFQEKLNHGESKENLAAISPGDKKKNKYGIFNRKKS